MACAGLKVCETHVEKHILKKNATRRTIDLAQQMMKFISEISYETKLELKIGIHKGSVIAGVLGHHKPQFSLIGDTVNTASRHCSTGDGMVITVSKSAYEDVKQDEFAFDVK